ncbi:predicted protein [Nematostella vectensis]|uniref:Metalloendopeptidase n=1 Tax=Nematostella vectensis TaxID=45351 RepID=A7RMF1_NEMVE|nr:predicted protein [Nematostella vectensis]|eukprot:XP_001639324.1 predicted protein [Nematostella vectensis]
MASRDEKRIWYDGVIPYVIDCSLSELMKVFFTMKEWESKTCVRFVEREGEDDYLTIFRGTHCYSTVGRAKGKRIMSVGNGCEYHHVMLHELGHVIGFWHEQSRPDRDEYVRVLWHNIAKGWENAFLKLSWEAVDTMRVHYDFSSIMHYPFDAFSRNNKRTLLPLIPVKATPYTKLTDRDVLKVNLMYKCSTICRDKLYSCKLWAKQGFCEIRKDFMPTECPKSCKICQDKNERTTTSMPVCKDRTSWCRKWASYGYCHTKAVYMLKSCKRSCGICEDPRDPSLPCEDKHKSCVYWASIGVCDVRPTYMYKHCRLACRVCTPGIKHEGPPCDNKDPDEECDHWAKLGKCASRPSYMMEKCQKSCNACPPSK